MPELGTKGAELDLLIRQGATLGPYNMTIKTADGVPIDLTGATFDAQIRRTPDGIPLTGVTFSFTISDPTNGVVDWSLPATASELLQAGDTETDPESVYVWDMEVELTSGRVIPIVYGVARVWREVTKVDV